MCGVVCVALTRAHPPSRTLPIRILRFLRELQFPTELTRIFETPTIRARATMKNIRGREDENKTGEKITQEDQQYCIFNN